MEEMELAFARYGRSRVPLGALGLLALLLVSTYDVARADVTAPPVSNPTHTLLRTTLPPLHSTQSTPSANETAMANPILTLNRIPTVYALGAGQAGAVIGRIVPI